MVSPEEFQIHVNQNKHRIRWWSERNKVKQAAGIHWGRLWDEVREDMKWDDMPSTLQMTVELAFSQAIKDVKAESELFPKDWNKEPLR